MPGNTNIQIFNQTSQNMVTDSEYASDAQRINGVIPGVARSELHNKLFRQFSVMGYAVAKFIVDQGYDALDTNPPEIATNLAQAIINVAKVGTNPFNFSWLSETNYTVGDIIFPTSPAVGLSGGFWMTCIISGRTGVTEPSWTEVGTQIDDGLCRWAIHSMRDAATIMGQAVGSGPNNILALNSRGVLPASVLNTATRHWWLPSTSYSVGEVIEPLSAFGGVYFICDTAGTTGSTEPVWGTTSGAIIGDGTVVWKTFRVTESGGNVGDIVFPTYTIRSNQLKLNGALLTRSAYPQLWAWAQSNALVISEALWGTNTGGVPTNTGAFSSGDGTTTFRLPDFRGYFFRVLDESRGLDSAPARALGSGQDSQNKSHTHSLTMPAVHGESGRGGRAWWSDGDSGGGSYTNTVTASGSTHSNPVNLALYAVIQYK